MTWLLVAMLCLNGQCKLYPVKSYATEAECLAAAKEPVKTAQQHRNPYNLCIWFGDQA